MKNKKNVANENVPTFEKDEKMVETKVGANSQVEAKNKVGEKNIKTPNVVGSHKEVSRVRKGSIKGAKLGINSWSKAKTAIVASLLIVIMLGCFGTTAWLVVTQFRSAEITATSYICKMENGQEKEIEKVSKNTIKLSFFEQGQGKSVANMGDKSLLDGQCLKIVYDLNNVGPRDITLRFEITTNKRENFNILLKKDGDSTNVELLGYLYDVDLKKGETSQIVFYIEIDDASSGADCDISINNSFYNRNGGLLWTLFK